MKIKCAIFDFDGTLFDSMFLWENLGERYLRSLGKVPEISLRDEIRTLSLDQSASYLRREYDLVLSEEEIKEGILRMIERFYLREVLPKPGVVEFLKKMKKMGISMCIATASEHYQIEAALKRCEMSVFFDKIFTCSEVGHGKDEPLIFLKAMKYFGADRSTSIVFEDAIHAVQTSKRGGFVTVAVFDNNEKQQNRIRQLADFYLKDFEHTQEFWEFVSAK